MPNVYKYLDELGISYEVHEHPAVFTVEDAAEHRADDIEYAEDKNLFLRNQKGNKHYLVTIPAEKQLDIKKLSEDVGEKLSFASPERLEKYLGLTPGSVSPFGLLNDENSEVVFILDKDLLDNKKIGFHPNINTQTIILKSEDVTKFLDNCGNQIIFKTL